MTTHAIDSIMFAVIPNLNRSMSFRIHFLGTHPFDLFPLPHLLSYPPHPSTGICCIVNTDPSSKPGQHWVAFYRDLQKPPGHIEFFDSYGHPPSFYSFSLPDNLKIQSNTHQLQSFSTNVCGQYCILFLLLRASHQHSSPLEAVTYKLHSLSTSSLLRDRQVATLISSLCSKLHSPTPRKLSSSNVILWPSSTSYIPSSLNQDSAPLSCP